MHKIDDIFNNELSSIGSKNDLSKASAFVSLQLKQKSLNFFQFTYDNDETFEKVALRVAKQNNFTSREEKFEWLSENYIFFDTFVKNNLYLLENIQSSNFLEKQNEIIDKAIEECLFQTILENENTAKFFAILGAIRQENISELNNNEVQSIRNLVNNGKNETLSQLCVKAVALIRYERRNEFNPRDIDGNGILDYAEKNKKSIKKL
ncbi:hypothetical protein ACOTVD_09535 [Campylobacter jejuni]|uniref:hypothetical protein n=1 Tax=Campylobacter jejuni TaxID=197 RepID=UPI003B9A837E